MNNSLSPYQSFGMPSIAVAQQRTFITRVYGWMGFGLLVTALVAGFTLTQEQLVFTIATNRLLFWGLILSEVAVVWILSGAINRLSPMVAGVGFICYATLNGLTLSMLGLVYTASSIAETFFVTAGTFGAMSAYGYFTKRDLTSWGNLLMMALFGLILASVVNLFLNNSVVYWITSFAGILIFVGLTAYDTQKIKRMSETLVEGTAADQKGAIMGALALYLDFINLFLMLLRLFGRRR